jgi:alpha-1,6-mannosyltransferase
LLTLLNNPDWCDLPLLISVIYFISLCPYTKVEESFNIQATHDLLELNGHIPDYDHLEFPGVVPRTFVGAIILSAVAFPGYAYVRLIKGGSKLHCQYLVRIFLGLTAWSAFVRFRKAVTARFGLRCGKITALLAALQFHLPFYMSRTLPNTFALIGCLHAFADWITGKPLMALVQVTIGMVLFRCDMLVLLAPMTLQMLLAREVSFWRTAFVGLGTGIATLAVSVLVDSYFWQRLVAYVCCETPAGVHAIGTLLFLLSTASQQLILMYQ